MTPAHALAPHCSGSTTLCVPQESRRGRRPHCIALTARSPCVCASASATRITVVGLGPGDPGMLTREAFELLTSAPTVHVRTATHPTLAKLLPPTTQVHSYDDIYEAAVTLQEVYPRVVSHLLDAAEQQGDVVYAVPGDPSVAEATVRLLREHAPGAGVNLRVLPGVSFIEPTLAALEIDLLPSLHLGDALDVAAAGHPGFNASTPALLSQLYSKAVAGDVKLTLMNQYPDTHEVALVHDAGSGTCASVEWTPIHAIDFSTRIGARTSLYVPPLPGGSCSWEAGIMDALSNSRDDLTGPWAEGDPTHNDAAEALVDAATAVADAVDDTGHALRDALADVLVAVALHAHVAADEGQFTAADLLAAAARKAREMQGSSGEQENEPPAVPAGRGYVVDDGIEHTD